MSHRVVLTFKDSIKGEINFEKLLFIHQNNLFEDCIDYDKSIFEKVDAIDPLTNQRYEIKKIGNSKSFLFTDPFAIKHDSDIPKVKNILPIDQYNYIIQKLHEIHGPKICQCITDNMIQTNTKIYILGDKILEVGKDFHLESRFVDSRFKAEFQIKKWEITIVLH